MAGDNRVPLPPVLEATSPLNGAMDNFDWNESTLAGTGSTHDTILVIFQSVPVEQERPSDESEISARPVSTQSRTTIKLRSKVSCQELITMGGLKARGEIDANYNVLDTVFNPDTSVTDIRASTSDTVATGVPSTTESTGVMPDVHTSKITEPFPEVESPATECSVVATTECSRSIKSICLDYFVWLVNRLSKRAEDKNCFVPGFTAMRSSTVKLNFHATAKILTPILPYPATTYDSIFTTMINFQDALKQQGDPYGGLWTDEGVYRIAKEIQLLKPAQFSNIFLGLSGFHMEKIVFACLGAYLEPSGIFSVLVETECFGPDTISGMMSGSHYSRSRTAHSMIHEVLLSMMIKAFLIKHPEKKNTIT